MFDLDDDFIWLIWIQLLIMFLLTLVILLSYFDFFTLDTTSACEADSLSLRPSSSSSHSGPPLSCSQTTMVIGTHNVRREVDASTGNKTSSEENCAVKDSSFAKDLASAPIPQRLHHPCSYFDFAKQAFLKCLGLGSISKKPTHKERDD